MNYGFLRLPIDIAGDGLDTLAKTDFEPYAPAISGSAFPGQTLTALVADSYQWHVDGAEVVGETSKTFTVRVADVGKEITVTRGGVESDPVTVWRPMDDGVQVHFAAFANVFTSISPDVVAADGETVRTWRSYADSSITASQSTSGSRPEFDEDGANGHPAVLNASGKSLQLFGVNDLFRAKKYGCLVVAAARNASLSDNGLFTFATPSGGTRIGLSVVSNAWALKTRSADADATTTLSGDAADTSHHVVMGEVNWESGSTSITVDDGVPTTGSIAAATSPDTSGDGGRVGANPSGTGQFSGTLAVAMAYSGNSPLSTSAKARLIAYAQACIA